MAGEANLIATTRGSSISAGGRQRSDRACAVLQRGYLGLVLAFAIVGACSGQPADAQQQARTMKITIKTDKGTVNATLLDTPTAKDFAALLPMTLTLSDYASTEKVSDLPRKLSTAGAPAGHDPSIDELTYYAPWGNLAIFYRDFGYSTGLIKLGAIDAGAEALNHASAFKATIEIAKE